MYDAVLSCIQRVRQLQELPADHEPSRDDLWDCILKVDRVLRLAVMDHPDFEQQIRSVLTEWGTNDLIESCLTGGVDPAGWVDIFAEQAEPDIESSRRGSGQEPTVRGPSDRGVCPPCLTPEKSIDLGGQNNG